MIISITSLIIGLMIAQVYSIKECLDDFPYGILRLFMIIIWTWALTRPLIMVLRWGYI